MMICWLVWSWEFCCCNSCLRFTTSFFRASSLTYRQHTQDIDMPKIKRTSKSILRHTDQYHNAVYCWTFTSKLITLCNNAKCNWLIQLPIWQKWLLTEDFLVASSSNSCCCLCCSSSIWWRRSSIFCFSSLNFSISSYQNKTHYH